MPKQLKIRRVKRMNKLNILGIDKRFHILFISMIAVLSILLLSSSKSYSQEDLHMKIVYEPEQETSLTWNLKDEHEFTQEWFTKEERISFTVDLSHYKDELGEGVIPFAVSASHNNDAVNEIEVKPSSTSSVTGKYNVSFQIPKEDGEIDIFIDIKEENEWGIPSGHKIPFKIKRDTTPPEVSVTGVEDGELFVPDEDGKPQFPVFKLEVEDEHFDPEGVYAIVDGKRNELKRAKDNIFTFDGISEDGKYNVQFSASDRNGNTKPTKEMTIYVHNDPIELEVYVDGKEKEDLSEPIRNNDDTELTLKFKNVIPIKD